MKKTPLLNAALSHAIARLGHGDMIVIADAGLPVPEGRLCIDLALSPGVPGFLQVLRAVCGEMQIEHALIAHEMQQKSATLRGSLAAEMPGVEIGELSHESLKVLTGRAAAIVRSGEFTPYANVVLVAGVVF
jgi:D-ribose pyranase